MNFASIEEKILKGIITIAEAKIPKGMNEIVKIKSPKGINKIAHAHQAKESISSMKGLEPQGRLNKSAFLLDLFFRFYQLSNSFFLTLADIKGLIP